MKTKMLAIAGALAASFTASGAQAAACTGAPPFTDVSAAANYCTNTEWLKNRAITLGCVGTNFCPNDVVTRGSMALFMNRLGTALTPEVEFVDAAPGAVDPDLSPIICSSGDHTASGFPRRAFVTATFDGDADGALSFQMDPQVSFDGGATWNFFTSNIHRAGTAGAGWTSATVSFLMDLAVGDTARFALQINRQGGTGDFATSRCFMTVQIQNRNGTSSPFDAVPLPETRKN